MPIQAQSVDIPIYALNEALPTTVGIAGRLRALNNGIAEKWAQGQFGNRLRIVKRDGFTVYSNTVRNTAGVASSKSIAGTTMLASRGIQTLACAGAAIFAESDSLNEWFTSDYIAPTNLLSQTNIPSFGAVTELPDSCHLNGLTMNVWTAYNGTDYLCYFNIIDIDGTIIRDTALNPASFTPSIMCKCLTDGQHFWLIVKPGNPALGYIIQIYDTNGVLLSTNTGIPQNASFFDITPNTATGSNGFVFIQESNPGPNFETRAVTWNGAAIVIGPAVAAGGCSTGKLAFLKNAGTDHKYYAVTVNGAGPFTFLAWQIDDATLTATSITLAAAQANAPFEISGWVNPSTALYTIALSFLDTTVPTPQLNYTQIWTISAGTPALAATRGSITVVSRAFALQGLYYVIAYYQSLPGSLPLTNNIQQSTFFLISLATTGIYQTCGEWNIGQAYADWHNAGGSTKWFHLSSPCIRQDGSTHVDLSFRVRSFTTAANVLIEGKSGVGHFQNLSLVQANSAVSAVGLHDYGFLQQARRSVEFANETLIPGPQVTSWIGDPSNHGISLVPEMFQPVVAAAGSGLSQNATYEVVCVAEWTNENNERVRSVAGPPYAFSTGAGQRQATYSGTFLQNEVGKTDLIISLYRTAFINGVQSEQHYKVTNDLLPIYNAIGTLTWTFIDTVTDAAAAANEILYVDKGFLDHYPCPPFIDGCADSQRSYVIGYDGAIWFSGSKSESDATWFHPAFRILLTNDTPKAIALLDTILLIFGANDSIYTLPTNALPGNDGSGDIPTPQILPLTHGATGPACTFSEGVMFPSTQGGIWLITRNFNAEFAGKAVIDYVKNAGGCVDIYQDKHQRVICLLANGSFAVYDAVTQAWYTWTLPNPVVCCGISQGALQIADATTIQHQSPGVVTDNNTAIVTTTRIQFQLGNVRGFKRIWNMQFEGEYRGDHDLTVNGYFDDDFVDIVETYVFTPSNVQVYQYELPPKVEECANVTLEFIDSFPRLPSAGYALEMLSFELGIEKGLARLIPSTQRKSAS